MIQRFLLAGLLATCSVPALAQDAPAPAEPPPMTFAPQVIDPADLDPAVRPGNDFFAYVNGKWAAATAIPAQYSTYGVATNLELGAQRDLREIVEQMAAANAPKGSIEQKVGDSYRAFMDRQGIEARGLTPLQPYLARIAAIRTLDDLALAFAAPGMPSPIGAGVGIDDRNPARNALFFGMGGMGLPDRDNYLDDTPRNLEMRVKYRQLLTTLLAQAGDPDPAGSADAVYALERRIAVADWDRAVSRDPELTYNKLSRAEFTAIAGAFPLAKMLDAEGILPDDPMIVAQIPPSAEKTAALGLSAHDRALLGGGMPEMFRIIAETPLATWRAWATVNLLHANSSVLPHAIDDADFAFYGTYLSGRTIRPARWMDGVSTVDGELGEAIGKLYVERHFPARNKAAMVQLVANLRKAMAEDQATLPWMTPQTRKEARAKLDAFTVKIGYPDKFKTYDGLDISPTDPVANAVASGNWQWHTDLSDLRKPVDRTKWEMTPQTVNAYYNPPANEIVFPAAFLQPPNYSPTADAAVNYGAIGSTIGHEISHGFDDQGAKYDGTGALRQWWQPADRAAFKAATDRLVAQYNGFCPFDGGKTCIRGELTLGENIADLSGLAIAYKAYHMALQGKPAPVIGGLTGDQRFFIAYALSFREKWSEALERRVLQTDPHSPDYARVNMVLRNFDPWYKAFDVKPDDKLYLPPDQRVKIW